MSLKSLQWRDSGDTVLLSVGKTTTDLSVVLFDPMTISLPQVESVPEGLTSVDLNEANGVVRLPACVLYAAALHATTDETKHAINSIDVRQVDGGIRVAATNGHVLFKCVVPTEQGMWWAPEHPLSLDPAAFKAVPKRKQFVAKLQVSGVVEFGDGCEFPVGGKWIRGLSYAAARNDAACFPNIDQLWPEKFNNSPGRAMALNPEYLGTICRLQTKFSDQGHLKWETNGHVTPTVWSGSFSEKWLGNYIDQGIFEWQVLAMPVQIRDWK